MKDLIEALTIFAKYSDDQHPTHCDHDVMYVGVDPADVSDEDKDRLEELSFLPDEGHGSFKSFRFGSN
jgi:hypothetical protein